jgi:hypothetical protein
MLIHFERTGGLLPRRLDYSATSATLPAEEERRLRDLLEGADFFHLPSSLTPASQGADRFRYRVTAELDGRQNTVELSDPVPADLAPLVQELTRVARKP